MKFIFDKEIWDELISSLRKNPFRTFLTSLGVIWGMFILIVLIGSGKGLETGVKSEWGNFSTNSMFIWGERSSIPYEGFMRGRQVEFTNKDVSQIQQNFPELQYLEGAVWVGGQDGANNVVSRGKESATFSIIGDGPDRFKIDAVNIFAGRLINQVDMQQKRKIIVIGKRVYETLYKQGENALGTYIKVNGIYFMVIGIFESQHSGDWAMHQNGLIYMPLPTAQQTFNLGDMVHWISLAAPSDKSITEIGEKIMKNLKKVHKIHPDDTMALGTENIEKAFRQTENMFMGISFLIWIVGFFTLFAGVIGISNIMLIVVKERTKEIGIRRAIGAKPRMILIQIIYEAVLLTVSSGYLGLLAGIGTLELMGMAFESPTFKNPEIDISLALIIFGILTFVGVLAGLIPAFRALKIKPIDALRDE